MQRANHGEQFLDLELRIRVRPAQGELHMLCEVWEAADPLGRGFTLELQVEEKNTELLGSREPGQEEKRQRHILPSPEGVSIVKRVFQIIFIYSQTIFP